MNVCLEGRWVLLSTIFEIKTGNEEEEQNAHKSGFCAAQPRVELSEWAWNGGPEIMIGNGNS